MGNIPLASIFTQKTNQEKKGDSRSRPYRSAARSLLSKSAGKAISCVFPRTPSRSKSFCQTRKPWDVGELRPVLCRPWQDTGRARFSPGISSNKLDTTIWATCKTHGYFFFFFFFPERKQVYNKTRTGKLTFYSLNFPWEEN